MRRVKYSKECWLLDEDILLHGRKNKYGVTPDREIQCGFSYQIVKKKDKDKIYFLSLKKAREVLGNIPVYIGKCNVICAIDNGMAETKVAIGVRGYTIFEKYEKSINTKEEVSAIVTEALNKYNINIKQPNIIFKIM